MSTEPGTTDPGDVAEDLTPEQRPDRLAVLFEQHRNDDRVPALSEQELIVVAELLGELTERTNPGPGADLDG